MTQMTQRTVIVLTRAGEKTYQIECQLRHTPLLYDDAGARDPASSYGSATC